MVKGWDGGALLPHFPEEKTRHRDCSARSVSSLLTLPRATWMLDITDVMGSLVPSWWQGAGVWGRMSGGEGISDPASLQGPGARGHGAHLPKPRRATVCVSAQLHPVGHPVGGLQSARYKYLHHPPRECRSQALPAPSPPRGLVVKHSPATLLGTSIGYLSY